MRRSMLLLCAIASACGSPPPPQPQTVRAAPKAAAPNTTETSDDCPKGMLAVPGGSLWLGSPDGEGAADEHPKKKTEIGEFCLGEREVTVADYRACEKNKACTPLPTEVRLLSPIPQNEQAALSAECSARLADNADLPATCVSWDEANRYCAWKGYRLPTEPEWEWSATGGADQLAWTWGASPPDDDVVCWQRRSPCHVGGKRAEAFELRDLAGNVIEWTSSPYGPYGGAPSGDKMVVRGGSWESTKEDELRPKHRGSRAKAYRDITLGFRCAKSR